MSRNFKAIVSIVSGVAAAAMLLAPAARAEVLLGQRGGWEVGFDGSVNNFAIYNTGVGGYAPRGNDHFTVRNGLLPAVLGVNVRAPSTRGLDMSARFGFYPSTNNPNGSKNQFGGQIDFREVFFNVSGDFGSVLAGKTLSLYLGRNILKDMTILGVGAIAGSPGATTTLGRIGYGYVYPNFNSAIRYTTPNFMGFQATIGVYEPSQIGSSGGAAAGLLPIPLTGAAADAGARAFTETKLPRIEVEASYAATIPGSEVNFEGWLNGLWQEADCATDDCIPNRAGNDEDVTALGVGGGVEFTLPIEQLAGTMVVTGTGYYGRGLGSTFLLDTDSIGVGGSRRNYGYYGQITHQFNQGTGWGLAYGGSYASPEDGRVIDASGNATEEIVPDEGRRRQTIANVLVWHNINDNLRVIAEYGYQETGNFGPDQVGTDDADVFSVGGFFFF